MAKKRATGGGRKPQGDISGKSAVFTTRITPETRRMLEMAAKANGRSLSQEVEMRLTGSFDAKGEQDKYLRAVLYLISQVARCLPAGDMPQTSKFHFLAFKAAVASLLDRLAATRPGPATLDPSMEEFLEPPLRTPEAMGAMAATMVWQQIRGTKRLKAGEEARDGTWPYAMPNAREALGIGFEEDAFLGREK